MEKDFHPRTWSDLYAIVCIASAMFAGVTWGLKLESRISELDNHLRYRVSEVEADSKHFEEIIGKGILPITEERLDRLQKDVSKIQNTLDVLVIKMK